jgi:hypothetical protein
MKRHFLGLTVGTVFLATLSPFQAQAATQLFTDRALFEAAIQSGFFLETFNTTPEGGYPNPLNFSGSGFSFSASAGCFFNCPTPLFPFTYTGGSATPSTALGTTDSAQPLTFTLGSGVTAFGGDFFGSNIAGSALQPGKIQLILNGFSSIIEWDSDTTNNEPQFIGVISDGADFGSIVLDPNPLNTYDPTVPDCDNFPCIFASADNVILGKRLPSTAVPGPLPIFGAAAAYSWSRKLRRRSLARKDLALSLGREA